MTRTTKKDLVKEYLGNGLFASSEVVSKRKGVKITTTQNILSSLKKEGYVVLRRGKINRWKIVEEPSTRDTGLTR